jgi:peptidoglycan/xylan/chitin deacetylase (PgdA/CDA1 family)
LTFDAEHPDRPWCPPRNAEHILDTLGDAGVRATFFVQGRWAESQPATARRIADEGHLVGHHSHYHARMPLLHDQGLQSDVLDAQAVIQSATGKDPRPWFRCPFGAGHDDPRILGLLEEFGYRNVYYQVVVDDWEPWRTGEEVERDAVGAALEHGDGAVVLLHTWPAPTAEAVPGIIRGLRASGAELVGVDALERLP